MFRHHLGEVEVVGDHRVIQGHQEAAVVHWAVNREHQVVVEGVEDPQEPLKHQLVEVGVADPAYQLDGNVLQAVGEVEVYQ